MRKFPHVSTLLRARWSRKLSILGFAVAPLMGCGGQGSKEAEEGPAPSAIDEATAQAVPVSLHVRGRIRSDTLVLEPAFLLPGQAPAQPETDAGHRLVGFDRDGGTLFDLGLVTVPVADLAGAREAHFQLQVPLSNEEAARLYRLEVHADDGRTASRTATFTPQGLDEAVSAQGAVTASRTNTGSVLLTWDAGRFPMVMVRDPENGQVLAFGRGGQVEVTTELTTLEVAVSDGVRSSTTILSLG